MGHEGEDPEIYTISTGGGSKLQVTDNSTGDSDPAYSPSGKRIAYEGYDGNDSRDLHHQGRRWGQAQSHRQLLGRLLPRLRSRRQTDSLYQQRHRRRRRDLYDQTRWGGKFKVTDNTSDDYYPSYSPSGKKIAYAGYDGNDSEIYTIKTRRGRKRQLTDNSTASYSPYWGPQ